MRIRWTATATVGLLVGAALLGLGIRWGIGFDAIEVHEATASADSLSRLWRHARCYATQITRDSLAGLETDP